MGGSVVKRWERLKEVLGTSINRRGGSQDMTGAISETAGKSTRPPVPPTNGERQLMDACRSRRTIPRHRPLVGTVAWTAETLASEPRCSGFNKDGAR